ncbi:hypothetical protein L226DRAFT_470213 [Lentinus tigrinus ALCF2SS1-7]|uniref:uncharacterized protein n=1 Tax=Lentinus tigrinus ALCF2SS1-7 TaxID=1328758 RepID=UPI00116602EC|nr:hypothetical protein L226DRAFT_470213 [Lentinus tigrinus ALCF2SS1-7]
MFIGPNRLWHSLKHDLEPELLERISNLERQLHFHLSLNSVGAADYALWSAGAYVLESLTSSTYLSRQHTWWRLWSSRPQHALQWKPPVLALNPEVHPGYCWAMEGSSGTLGVSLAQTIIAQAVTIDHVAKPLLFQYTSAPKEVEVWIIPEGHSAMGPDLVTATAAQLLDHTNVMRYTHDFLDSTFVNLVNFTYDIHALQPTQTFPVADDMAASGIKTNAVLFRFRNNWGNDAYTCVYRVRVHGTIVNK